MAERYDGELQNVYEYDGICCATGSNDSFILSPLLRTQKNIVQRKEGKEF